MKRILCAVMILILTGCATKPADPTDIVSTPVATQTPEAAVMPAPEATKTPAVSEPEATETPTAESTSYTAIMLPMRDTYPPVMLAEDDLVSDGYYTMCQDGKWGLMESDGSVLLPCRADNPVRRCASSTLKWHYVVSASSEDWKTYNDTLTAANAGTLCSGEHDGLLHPCGLQLPNGLSGVLLHRVGDDDVARVGPVHREMDDGAHAVAGNGLQPQPPHQLVVACGHWDAVHLGGDAVAADLLNVAHTVAVDGLAVGALEALADGVGGGTFRQRRVFQQLFVFHLAVVNAADLENALRQRAGLVKDDRFDL